MRPTRLRGARTNNLKRLDLEFEPGSLVAIVGPSGAGKSSLAFRTLYAEGQRRYVESFSAYARQFLERLARPRVDSLEPVPPGISVDRQGSVKTSRSTVGTLTDLTDYAKDLWAVAATLTCPACARPVAADSPGSAVLELGTRAPEQRVTVLYQLTVSGAEHFLGVREQLVRDGYRRLWLGARGVRDIDEVRPSEVVEVEIEPTPEQAAGDRQLWIVTDRTTTRASDRARLVEALEAAFERGAGRAAVQTERGERHAFSRALHCASCDRSFRRPSPGLFSFNNPIGACTTCRGFGRTIGVDWDKVIPDPTKSLGRGAIRAWMGKATQWERRELRKRCATEGIPLDVPFEQLTTAQRRFVLEGEGDDWPRQWFGVRGWFRWMESRAYKMHVRVLLARYRKYETCVDCGGARLKPEALWWRVAEHTLAGFYAMPVGQALEFVQGLKASLAQLGGVPLLLDECGARLQMLCDVGLGYLTLSRSARSLSGGELQRVALSSALGASLTGAMFVLDEPTTGLHPADVATLVSVVQRLSERGNLALVVEHDPAMLLAADRVIELGPGSGENGGQVVFDASPSALAKADTATARALARRPFRARARRKPRAWLRLQGASGRNLKQVDLSLPLGVLTCVTGVSGSGKSSLILDTLQPALARALGCAEQAALAHAELSGTQHLTAAIRVDQAPLGRTSRGNPATYLGCWEVVRKRLAATRLARERGYLPGMFSFNVAGGRCEACKGEGAETVEMQFLADVTFSCPECGGRRFVGPILDVTLGGASVADILEFTANQALAHFEGDREIRRTLEPLISVGAGYLRLGQPLSQLSGGEAQRLKLADALGRASSRSLLVLDEPTAGLHATDVDPLLGALQGLVQAGNSVVVVEHDMRVAAEADHVIDLGPGAGALGGRIVVQGTPAEVAACEASATAPFLARALAGYTLAGDNRRPEPRRRTRPRSSGVREPAPMRVRGAREHNLLQLSLDVPRDRLVVVTGPSGSGKSTLAFDIIHAEGQRRYLETLSPYARQYLPQLPRAAVDSLTGVPPSVSLQQRLTAGGANSTVATITEVAHYARLVFARAGILHCPDCALPIQPRSAAALARDLGTRFAAKQLAVLAPVVRGRKGNHMQILENARAAGSTQARVDGAWLRLRPGLKLERYKEHDIDLLVAKLRADDRALHDVLTRGFQLAQGTVRVECGQDTLLVSCTRSCPRCARGFAELDPRIFSFNTRQGACPSCEGRGYEEVSRARRSNTKSKSKNKTKYSLRKRCSSCDGRRLTGLAMHVTVAARRIIDWLGRPVSEALSELNGLKLSGREAEIARVPLAELRTRLRFLDEVGLGYLGLDRAAWTLSGGELQRVRLAAQLGSGLTGLLYVLDEPTIGLHPRDTGRLLRALRALTDKGCSVLVVEHDAYTIRAADHVIDMGPGGGRNGGRVLAQGTPAQLAQDPDSVTGPTLRDPASTPEKRRSCKEVNWLELFGAREHNLRALDLRVPLARLVCVSGVSGSGKSTLVREVLLRAVRKALRLQTEPPGRYDRLAGVAPLRRAVEIDQSPIGRTPRSVPATYVGVWDEVRRLYAATPLARARGYSPSRFSFNLAQGRCSVCEGQGVTSAEMSFLPQVFVPCEACGGQRFNPETLDVRLHGLSAGDLLTRHVDEVAEILAPVPKVARPLGLLAELGLGYLTLGQASNSLSGGEAQRMKLVAELGGQATAPTLYVMDEPTTGLHRTDVRRLLTVLGQLVERGHSVVVIEHHPDVILAADWVADLGPEGGAGGGRLVAEGPPEQIMRCAHSHTGAVLKSELGA